MSYKYVLILLSILLFIHTKTLKQAKIIKAINCGMKEGTARIDSIKYQNDANAVSGKSVDVDYHSNSDASNVDIKYSIEKEIYMFERHTYSEMTYSLPVRFGTHTLILKFSQMYFNKPGQRVFNVKIGNTVVVENLDVVAKTGSKFAAHQQYIELTINKNIVIYKGVQIKSAIKNNNLQVTFSKGKADNPIVQGIILYHGPIQQTTYSEYNLMKKDWSSHQQLLKAKKENDKIRDRLATIKKKQKIVIRNDQLLIQQDNQGGEDNAVKVEKYGMIRSFLMSPIGIVIWTGIFVWKIIFVYNRILQMSEKKQQ